MYPMLDYMLSCLTGRSAPDAEGGAETATSASGGQNGGAVRTSVPTQTALDAAMTKKPEQPAHLRWIDTGWSWTMGHASFMWEVGDPEPPMTECCFVFLVEQDIRKADIL